MSLILIATTDHKLLQSCNLIGLLCNELKYCLWFCSNQVFSTSTSYDGGDKYDTFSNILRIVATDPKAKDFTRESKH